MIVFIPAYDEATCANFALAQSLSDDSCHLLFREHALAENLKSALQNKLAPLFAMSHGAEEYFCDQNQCPALTPNEVHLLGGRQVFVFACYTANTLGKIAARKSTIYWGYTGAIQALDPHPLVANRFHQIFTAILENFPCLISASDIGSFLIMLKNLCEQVNHNLDDLCESNSDFDILEAFICSNHIWSRLRIHHPDLTEPISHPEAPTGYLFA
jgi:hypothetical protein